ncbi:MAG: glycosyltransferase family 1 protein [Verrucomicrobiota bacterium]
MPSSIPKVLLSAGMIQGGLSGVGRYVVELAERIAGMDSVDLHVAGLDADRKLFAALDDAHWVSIPESASGGLKNLLWHQQKLPALLKAGGYDLLHIPSYRRIVAFCPVRQLATIHDCAPFRLRDKYGALRGLFGRQVAPWMARRCEHILTVSKFTKQDLINFFKLPDVGTEVVYNGLNHSLYRSRSDEETGAFRARQGIDRPFLLFISRLEHPGKNHVRLIEAYEAYRDEAEMEHLLVLGGAPWHGAEVIEERVAQSPYAEDILMPGFIEEADLPLWYASADGLVFPSLIEGFGLPVVEALACGCRVATSDRGSLPEVGGDAAIYFDPEDVQAISLAITELCGENPSVREARIAKGLSHAGQFDWDRAAMVTCQTYLKTTRISEKQ